MSDDKKLEVAGRLGLELSRFILTIQYRKPNLIDMILHMRFS